MKIVKGKYNEAKIFTNDIDKESLNQVQTLVDHEIAKDSIIRMMPDVHAGNGCVIGTTMTIKDKVAPSLVGVDIGCGMLTCKLDVDEIDFAKLDDVIKNNIPVGFNKRQTPHRYTSLIKFDKIRCIDSIKNVELNGELSMGTLGGGNHFIEVNKGKDGYYLVVHSGSRNIGLQVANYYIKQAKQEWQKEHKGKDPFYYCENQLMKDYLHDMRIMQSFADYNRQAIISDITEIYDLNVDWMLATIHNYIDMDSMILRKGAVSAKAGEELLIPLNMRDGSILAKGKGNKDWNYSAPHGAGRLYGRREAKEKFKVEDFEKEMKNVYTTCVSQDTLDEAPFCYKDMNSILSNISDTVDLIDIIKPVYNFKA